MRIKCPHCGGKAIITHSEPLDSGGVNRSIYLQCIAPGPDCGARSVMRITHAATITPPAATQTDAMHEWFANLPPGEQAKLARKYQPSLFPISA